MVGVTSLFLFISATSARHEHLEERSLASLDWNKHVNGVSIARKWGVGLSGLLAAGSTVGAVGLVLDPFLAKWYEPTEEAPAEQSFFDAFQSSGTRKWGSICLGVTGVAASFGAFVFQRDPLHFWPHKCNQEEGLVTNCRCESAGFCRKYEGEVCDFAKTKKCIGTKPKGRSPVQYLLVFTSAVAALAGTAGIFAFWLWPTAPAKASEGAEPAPANTSEGAAPAPASGGLSKLRIAGIVVSAVTVVASVSGALLIWFWKVITKWSFSGFVDAITPSRKSVRWVGSAVGVIFFIAGLTGVFTIHFDPAKMFDSVPALSTETEGTTETPAPSKSLKTWLIVAAGVLANLGGWLAFISMADPFLFWPSHAGAVKISSGRKFGITVLAMTVTFSFLAVFIFQVDPFTWLTDAEVAAPEKTLTQHLGTGFSAAFGTLSVAGVLILRLDPFSWFVPKPKTKTTTTTVSTATTPGPSGVVSKESSVASEEGIELVPANNTSTTLTHTTTTHAVIGTASEEASEEASEGASEAEQASEGASEEASEQASEGASEEASEEASGEPIKPVTTKAPAKNTIKTKKTTTTTTTGGATTYGFTALALLLITA